MFEKILTKDFLIQEYKINHKTKAQLAREVGCTVDTINNYIKKYHIPTNTVSSYISVDLSLEKFDRLQPKYITSRDKHGKVRWFCQCDCGKTKIINASSLLRRLTKSCGCLKHEVMHKGYEDISKSWWRRVLDNAKYRNYEINITPEYVWDIYLNQDKLCALSGVPIYFNPDSNKPELRNASIDRIDSGKGYIIDNIQLVHKVVNFMKSHWKQSEFIAWCNLIARRHTVDYETCKERAVTTIARKIRFRGRN